MIQGNFVSGVGLVSVAAILMIGIVVYQQRCKSIYKSINTKDHLEKFVDDIVKFGIPLDFVDHCPKNAICVADYTKDGKLVKTVGIGSALLEKNTSKITSLIQDIHTPTHYIYLPDSHPKHVVAMYLRSDGNNRIVGIAYKLNSFLRNR